MRLSDSIFVQITEWQCMDSHVPTYLFQETNELHFVSNQRTELDANEVGSSVHVLDGVVVYHHISVLLNSITLFCYSESHCVASQAG